MQHILMLEPSHESVFRKFFRDLDKIEIKFEL